MTYGLLEFATAGPRLPRLFAYIPQVCVGCQKAFCVLGVNVVCANGWYRMELVTPYTPGNFDWGDSRYRGRYCILSYVHPIKCVVSHPTHHDVCRLTPYTSASTPWGAGR